MSVKIHNLGSEKGRQSAIVAAISTSLVREFKKREKVVLVVPGGRTAKLILPVLSQLDLPWNRITVLPADERWVPKDHDDSNEGLIAATMSSAIKKGARLLGIKTDGADPFKELETIEAKLTAIELPLAVVFLGMGEDGHVASIFPFDSRQESPKGMVCATLRPDHPRVSLTPRLLLNSTRIVLAVSGKAKYDVIAEALQPGDADALPVRFVLHQDQTTVDVFTC